MDFFSFVHVGFFNFNEDLEELLRLTALYKGMREAICLYNLKNAQCFTNNSVHSGYREF